MKTATIAIAALAACWTTAALAAGTGAPAEYDGIIARHSRATGVPETLIRRVIVRESKYNPRAMHSGHYGMMQIKPATAKAMGYRGSAAGLLDADVNLTYGVRYLAGAWKVAGGDHDRAMRYYASGYYYDAKRKGMLAQIGMGRDGALSAPPAAPSPMPATATTGAGPVRLAVVAPAAPAQPAPALALASIPTPPVRGAAPATAAATSQGAPAALAAAVPLPRPRGSMPAGAPAPLQTATAPVLAAAIPTPRPRDAGPETTGSIAAPPATLASVAPTAAKPRTISPSVAPALASAGPVLPAARSAAIRPAPALAYAETPGAIPVPQPKPAPAAPSARR